MNIDDTTIHVGFVAAHCSIYILLETSNEYPAPIASSVDPTHPDALSRDLIAVPPVHFRDNLANEVFV